MYLLFNLLRPWEWTDAQTANVISVISAAATVGALLYAYSLERKNSKKINDLAEIAKHLADQNNVLLAQHEIHRLQFKEAALPLIEPDKVVVHSETMASITFKSCGKRFKIANFRDKIDDYTYTPSLHDVLPGDEFIFYARPKYGKKVSECRFIIMFEYIDIYGNRYEFKVTGNGDSFTSWTHHEITPDSPPYE